MNQRIILKRPWLTGIGIISMQEQEPDESMGLYAPQYS